MIYFSITFNNTYYIPTFILSLWHIKIYLKIPVGIKKKIQNLATTHNPPVLQNVGVSVCSKHFYYYLFSSHWEFMSKIAIGNYEKNSRWIIMDNIAVGLLWVLVANLRVACDYFLRWFDCYYYFVIWTNLMKSNSFHNHIYIFCYYRIILFKFWNLNSTIVGWLIFTSLSQLNTFCMLHVNLLFHKGWNNVANIFFYGS